MLCTVEGPLFAQPASSVYLWTNVIEKAWLKTTGFTEKVIGKSTPEEVFEAFVNYPYRRFMLEDVGEEEQREMVKEHLYKMERGYGYVLTTRKEPSLHIGLSGRKHLYLLGSVVYDGKRLFYIRNPCGAFNFRGQYDQPDPNL